MAEPIPSTDTLDAKEIEAESIAAVQESPASARRGSQSRPHASEKEEMPAEIQVAIAAAAVALLGNNARVRGRPQNSVEGCGESVDPAGPRHRAIVPQPAPEAMTMNPSRKEGMR